MIPDKYLVYFIVNNTMDNQVGVRNYNCDPGKVLIDICHQERDRQFAQITPSQARRLAHALNRAADEVENMIEDGVV